MRVTIFDYGAGNLHSLAKAICGPKTSVQIESDPEQATCTDVLVLPGVGAFATAAGRLAPARVLMRSALEGGLPAIGVCLGMQLLLDGSDEGDGAGLGLIPGRVTRLAAKRVPQIGWNRIEDAIDPLFSAARLETVYYANGYVCRLQQPADVIAWSTHEGDRFPAAIRRRNVLGVQFHPEKSSAPGVRFLRAAIEEVSR